MPEEVKQTTKDILEQPKAIDQEEVKFEDDGTVDFRDINDLIEVVDDMPTSDPIKVSEQVKIYNGAFYFYDYSDQTWKQAGGGFTDKGFSGAYNLAATADGAWHTWDISSIVPLGTSWIKVKARVASASTGTDLSFKSSALASGVSDRLQLVSIASTNMYLYFDVPIVNQEVDYNASSSLTAANFYILAYQ